MLTIDRRTTLSPYAKFLNNKTDSDILLLVGPSKEPIHAHSFVLKAHSDFYKTALNGNWGRLQGQQNVIEHPEIQPDVLMVILKLFYTGIIEIPSELIVEVIYAANLLLLVDEMVRPCMAHFQEFLLSASNAFTFYKLANMMEGVKEYATEACYALSGYVRHAATTDRECLRGMSCEDVKGLLVMPIFSDIDKWMLVLHWGTLHHLGTDAQDMENSWREFLDDELDMLRNDVEKLIDNVNLFSLSKDSYEKFVKPSLSILPTRIQRQAELFFSESTKNLVARKRIYNVRCLDLPSLTEERGLKLRKCLEEHMGSNSPKSNTAKHLENKGTSRTTKQWRQRVTIKCFDSFKSFKWRLGDVLVVQAHENTFIGLSCWPNWKSSFLFKATFGSADDLNFEIFRAKPAVDVLSWLKSGATPFSLLSTWYIQVGNDFKLATTNSDEDSTFSITIDSSLGYIFDANRKDPTYLVDGSSFKQSAAIVFSVSS
jgi:hypothetical protein